MHWPTKYTNKKCHAHSDIYTLHNMGMATSATIPTEVNLVPTAFSLLLTYRDGCKLKDVLQS